MTLSSDSLDLIFPLDHHIYITVQGESPDKSSPHGNEYSGNVLLLTAICFTTPLPFRTGRKEQGSALPREEGKEEKKERKKMRELERENEYGEEMEEGENFRQGRQGLERSGQLSAQPALG